MPVGKLSDAQPKLTADYVFIREDFTITKIHSSYDWVVGAVWRPWLGHIGDTDQSWADRFMGKICATLAKRLLWHQMISRVENTIANYFIIRISNYEDILQLLKT